MTRLYGLTADEWFHVASDGPDSEVPPCCGNIGAIRDAIRDLLPYLEDGELYLRRAPGLELLKLLDGDGDQHDLRDRETFPLLNTIADGLRAELC
jgi:hypothetical protein